MRATPAWRMPEPRRVGRSAAFRDADRGEAPPPAGRRAFDATPKGCVKSANALLLEKVAKSRPVFPFGQYRQGPSATAYFSRLRRAYTHLKLFQISSNLGADRCSQTSDRCHAFSGCHSRMKGEFMTTALTVSISKGPGCLAHNDRTLTHKERAGEQTWYPELVPRNIVFKNEKLSDVYEKLFQPSVDKYNSKIRKDRRIKSYLDKIQRSKQEKPFYEYVAAIGNLADVPAGSDLEELCQKVLTQYVQDFQTRNPNLYLFQAIMHNDEKGVPHLHIDFVPYSTGNKRGLEVKNSFSGAMREMGFKGPDGFAKWRQRELDTMISLMKQAGLDFKPGNGRQDRLSIPEYKDLQRQTEAVENREQKVEQKERQIRHDEIALNSQEKLLQQDQIQVMQDRIELNVQMDLLNAKTKDLRKLQSQIDREQDDFYNEKVAIEIQLEEMKSEITDLDRQIYDKKILISAHDQIQTMPQYRKPSSLRNAEQKDYSGFEKINKLSKKPTGIFEIPKMKFLEDRKELLDLAEFYAEAAWREKNRADSLEKAIQDGKFRPSKEIEQNRLEAERLITALEGRTIDISHKEEELDERSANLDLRASNLAYKQAVFDEQKKTLKRSIESHRKMPALLEKIENLEKENKSLKSENEGLREHVSVLTKAFERMQAVYRGLQESVLRLGLQLHRSLTKGGYDTLTAGLRKEQPDLFQGMQIHNRNFDLQKKSTTAKQSRTKAMFESVIGRGKKLISYCLSPGTRPANFKKELEDYEQDADKTMNFKETDHYYHSYYTSYSSWEDPEEEKDDEFDFGF